MASLFGFGQSADVDLELDEADKRRVIQVRSFNDDASQQKQKIVYLYYDGETISGKVCVRLKKPGQKLEHQGIKIDFIGHIEVYYDRGTHNEFCSLTRQLAQPGELMQNTDFRFDFTQVEKPFESYTGANVKLRYFLRVIISRRLSDIVREFDILVHTLSTYPDGGTSIRMEVGIEDCLHIEFEYNKSRYHLKDVIVGKIYFLLVRIKIKHMEIAIIKRESVGPGPNMYNDSETIAKYEIMDGAPVKSESIPIRLFLAGYDLTPTMKDINKKFSVRYYLNLVLVDEEDRRYFKQQEIVLWRKADRLPRRPFQQHAMASYDSSLRQQQQQSQQQKIVASSSSASINNNNNQNIEDDSGETITTATRADAQQQQQSTKVVPNYEEDGQHGDHDQSPPAEPTPPYPDVAKDEL